MSPLFGSFNSPPQPPSGPTARPPGPDWPSLFDLLEEGVLALNSEKKVALVNQRMASFLGLPAPDILGKSLWEFFRHREISAMADRVLAGHPKETIDVPLGVDGDRLFNVTAAGYASPGGPGALLVFADITKTRRLESARKDFVANVSHELKTPLTALRAAIETLREGALEDRDVAKDFLGTALEQVDRLQRLIEDLLSLSLLENPKTFSGEETGDVAEVARRVLSALAPVAAKHGVTLVPLKGPANVPVAVSKDELAQILMNLCDNAIKFNRSDGRVAIELEQRDNVARLSVRDTGVGILPEDLPRVFERFYRADKARSKETGGTGLGLAIVKHIVENRRGAVRVESRPGEGSLFVVDLPLPPPAGR